MGKKKYKNTLEFLGMASEQVTGSSYLINWQGYKILLECGGSQTNNVKEDYEVNSRQFKFKPKDLDFVMILHFHSDHIFLVPKLVKEGFVGKIITPNDSFDILKIMWEDSAHIISKDCDYLIKQYKKNYKPIYEKEDVLNTLHLIEECDFNKEIKLNDSVSFMLLPSQHIIRASQLILTLKDGSKVRKIGYSSDLGNTKFGSSLYCEDFIPIKSVDIMIGETTYCSKDKSTRNFKDRQKDLEKIKSVIDQFVIENKRKVLIPAFALHRCEIMLKLIYDIYKDSREDFDIVLDTPMGIKLTKLYYTLLKGKDKEEFGKILEWNKLKLAEEYDASRIVVESDRPTVIISASGMLTAGRSVSHLQSIIEDEKSCVLTCGYSSPNTLAGKIKEGKFDKIKIANEEFKNKVQLVQLTTMSSHMQYDELIEYYNNINCNSIYLVHGNEDRYKFASELQDKYGELNKTTKVWIGVKDTIVDL